MSARSLYLAATLLGLASAGVFEVRVIVRQREELRALQKRTTTEARQVANLRREHDALRHDLGEAERELASLPAPPEMDAATAARRLEIKAWLARVKQLKRIFDERPQQRSPEMQLITDEDWLRVAKRASFDDEHGIRTALGDLRSQAKTRFFRELAPALRTFAKTANGEPPPSILVLAALFQKPIDAAILDRYEIFKAGSSSNAGGAGLTVREKTAIDEDYDSRPYLSSNGLNSGGGSIHAPIAWIPDFQARMQRAYRDYIQANNGAKPAGMAQALPYFTPPLDPAKAELVLRFERERGP